MPYIGKVPFYVWFENAYRQRFIDWSAKGERLQFVKVEDLMKEAWEAALKNPETNSASTKPLIARSCNDCGHLSPVGSCEKLKCANFIEKGGKNDSRIEK